MECTRAYVRAYVCVSNGYLFVLCFSSVYLYVLFYFIYDAQTGWQF